MVKKFFGISVTRLLIIAFLVISLLGPLIAIFINLFSTDLTKIYTSENFLVALKNSLASASIATIISVSLAYLLAWAISRSNIRFKGIIIIAITIPMLIPSISHGTGLVILLGNNGILKNIFNLNSTIYGLKGIVAGSVMYSFPVAFLMFLDVLKYEDYTLYEVAEVLNIPKKNQFKIITLAFLKRPLISITFAIFTMIFTDYGVSLMVGGRYTTLPLYMYQEVIGLLDYGKGTAIGLILLIPAVIAFVFDLLTKENQTNNQSAKTVVVKENSLRDVLTYLLCGITIFLIALPIFAFGILMFVEKYPVNMAFTLNNIKKTFDMSAGEFLINSIVIALIASTIGVIIAYLTAYITTRTNGRTSKYLHLLSITSLAVPGVVLGIAYILFFKTSIIYGTMIILVLVNIIHFFASPYLLAYNALSKLNENFEGVADTLGVNKFHLIKDVFIPQTKDTILEMFSYFFVNSMITISAVSFLATSATKPISLMITQFEAVLLLECSAFVSVIILLINILLKISIYIIKRIRGKQHGINPQSI